MVKGMDDGVDVNIDGDGDDEHVNVDVQVDMCHLDEQQGDGEG